MSTNGRPRVLWVTPRMPWPALSGGERRVLGSALRLAARWRVTLLTTVGPADAARAAASALHLESRGLEKVRVVPRPMARPAPSWNRFLPETAARFHDPAFEAAVIEELDAGVDLVQLEFSEMGQYAGAAEGRAPVVFTEHDAGSLTGDRDYLRPAAGAAPWAAAFERAKRRLYLRGVARRSARVVAVSPSDAVLLDGLAGAGKVRVVPTGVDLAEFPFHPLPGRAPGEVLFVGFYGHYPNEDAAVFLAQEVQPLLQRAFPGSRLRLGGSHPTPRVRGLAGDGVEVVGTLPRVQPLLERARLFAAPVRLGRGIKGKLLEAFASGVPVVASPEACEGIPGLRDGEHLLLARGAADFAAACGRVLRDDALAVCLAAAGRTFVEDGWDEERQARKLEAVWRELVDGGVPA
ncbi:MAG: glycosyltransferase family 4 protein [Elusimicrobiota bacterium]|nr:glycosyltransferase family 4 protein [Elusimicrobiota bacterium]